jgi:hypothetical protein
VILELGQCALKDWILESGMSGRLQSTIISALRGADADDSPEVKRLVRWVRKQTVKENNPGSHFMKDCDFIDVKSLMDQDAWQWDRLKRHFFDHLKDAISVIAYFHPDQPDEEMINVPYSEMFAYGLKMFPTKAGLAWIAYLQMCKHRNLKPRSKAEMISTRRDTVPLGRGNVVSQDWILQLSGRMQVALLCAARGSDNAANKEVRHVTHWVRQAVFKNVAPQTHYMSDPNFMKIGDLLKEEPEAWGNLPIHFIDHIKEALAIIGYFSPNKEAAERGLQAYQDLCQDAHAGSETKQELEDRMKDKPGSSFDPVTPSPAPNMMVGPVSA